MVLNPSNSSNTAGIEGVNIRDTWMAVLTSKKHASSTAWTVVKAQK